MRKFLALSILCTACALAHIAAVPAWADEPAAAKTDSPAEEKNDDAQGGEKGGKAPEGVSGGRFAGDPIYVHLDPIVLPVISDAGVEQLVTLVIQLEARDFKAAEDIHTKMPRVMDALMTALYGGLGQGSLRNGKLVNVNKVRAKALDAVQAVTGPGTIKSVLIQGVAQRML